MNELFDSDSQGQVGEEEERRRMQALGLLCSNYAQLLLLLLLLFQHKSAPKYFRHESNVGSQCIKIYHNEAIKPLQPFSCIKNLYF